MAKNNKKIIIIVILIALAIFVLPKLELFSVYYPQGAIVAVEGSWINEYSMSTNYGSSDFLNINGIGTGDKHRIALIKFNLPSEVIDNVRAGGAINSATLYLYFNDVNNGGSIDLKETTSSWSEANVNWNNKPLIGNIVSSNMVYVSDDNSYKSFGGIEAYIENRIKSGETQLSFAVTTENDQTQYSYAASIYDARPPGVPGPAPTIESPYMMITSSPPIPSNCSTAADTNCDRIISFSELNAYANRWAQGSISLNDLIIAARVWVGN